ncbi:GNAT family N-acetyltransferase [Patescibacteria group bacterium]|nr:GNAT family N-acetyltransferase [Patescibacteria group bacterium]
MHQKTFQDAYTNKKIGLTKKHFSKKVFSSLRIQDYLRSNLTLTKKQKTWVVFLKSEMIGSITRTDKGKEYELRGFYVLPKYQGRGIGKQLWKHALNFAKRKDITLDIYAHQLKTINMYKKWGFKIDRKKKAFYRHWAEWPKRLKAKCIYMRLSSKS